MTQTTDKERAEFEAWLGIKPCGAAHDLAWKAWQASRRAQVVPDWWGLREALETMVEMVEMNGFGKAYAMDVASAALAAAPQPPEAACNPSVQPFIESRDVVSTGSGITVTRCNLSEAGREALQCKADHIEQPLEMVAAPVQLPEPVAVAFRFETEESGPTETSFYPSDRIGMGWTALYTEHQVRQLLADHNIK